MAVFEFDQPIRLFARDGTARIVVRGLNRPADGALLGGLLHVALAYERIARFFARIEVATYSNMRGLRAGVPLYL